MYNFQVTVSFAFIVIPSTVLMSLRGVAVDRRNENSDSSNLQIPEYANDLGPIIQSFNLAGDVVALLFSQNRSDSILLVIYYQVIRWHVNFEGGTCGQFEVRRAGKDK